MNMEHPLKSVELPESLAAIRDIIGIDNALKLVANCGGTRMFVPKRITSQHPLANMLGLKTARELSRHFGGESISVVRGDKAIRARRDKEIVTRYAMGARVVDLARFYSLTERRIYTILSGETLMNTIPSVSLP